MVDPTDHREVVHGDERSRIPAYSLSMARSSAKPKLAGVGDEIYSLADETSVSSLGECTEDLCRLGSIKCLSEVCLIEINGFLMYFYCILHAG